MICSLQHYQLTIEMNTFRFYAETHLNPDAALFILIMTSIAECMYVTVEHITVFVEIRSSVTYILIKSAVY